MEAERRDESGEEAKVASPTSDSDSEKSSVEDLREHFYEETKGRYLWGGTPDIIGEALYRNFYRDQLIDSVKGEFFKVQVSDLDSFCRRHDPDASCLRDMLSDAVMFFKLHNTWQVYICPTCDCPRWFPDDDSLVLHLKSEHCHALPFLRLNPTEEQRFPEALHTTAWRPIDVRVALNALSALNNSLYTDCFGSLKWPFPEDCSRSKLLAQLVNGFEKVLLDLDSGERDSFTVCSRACLRALIAVASDHVLRHLDPINTLPLPLRYLFYCSPLPFLFMEEDSLGHFVSLLEGIRDSTLASQNREVEGGKDDDAGLSKSECPDAVSFSTACDYLFLDDAKLNFSGADDMGSWLFKAPYFPTVEKLPPKASEILQLAKKKAASFSECLQTVRAQSDLKLLTSCLEILNMGRWPIPILAMTSPDLSSNSESNAANVGDMMATPCCSFREPSKRQRTEFESGVLVEMQHYVKLIKLAWELQFLELQVRRLCAVDLRDCILLPLLKSFLRLKFYLSIRTETAVFVAAGVEEEDDSEGNNIMKWSREDRHEEHVYSNVEGESAAGDGSITTTPDTSFYKRSEEVSTSPPELVSRGSSAISASDVDPMMIYGGEALEGEPPGASALSRSRTGIAVAIAKSEAKPEAMPESGGEPESKAELESQQSQEAQGLPCCLFDMLDMFPDSDTDSLCLPNIPIIDVGMEMKEFLSKKYFESKEFSTLVWLMREKCTWDYKDDGLFVCMTINDVVKHCLENKKIGLETAQNIWGWKTSRTRKCWRCFTCKKMFPDQKSHMLHLRLFWDYNDWLVPIQVQQEGRSGVNEGVNERTLSLSLDDWITVDSTYRRFIVEIGNLRNLYETEEEGHIKNISQLHEIFCDNLKEIGCLPLFCAESKLCLTSEVGEVYAEIVQNFASLKMSKQFLSSLCVSDYKNEILPCIHSFMQEHLGNAFRSWAQGRLDELLRDVRCPSLCLPDSFLVELESPGKVIINIEEYDAGITFAYLGIRWKLSGDVSVKESKKIKGIFVFSGISNSDNSFRYQCNLILDKDTEMTVTMFYFRDMLESDLWSDLRDKLHQFQAEVRRELQKVVI